MIRLDYEHVKAAILRAYELVPEAYLQKFRNHKKLASQTYVEFVREKGTLFDKWCSSCKVSDYKSLREMLLVEQLKRCLPDRMVVYLNERMVSTLSCAVVLADEYVLTHKATFGPQPVSTAAERKSVVSVQTSAASQKEESVSTAANRVMSLPTASHLNIRNKQRPSSRLLLKGLG